MASVRAGRRTLRCPSSWFLQQHHSHKLHCEAEHHLVAEPFPAKKKVSPLERFALRIQAAYERIRLKNLSPQLRAAAAAASAHTIRSESDLANVVEQRIWHSAVEGDFEHLPGKGKPLKVEGNPHADPAEDLLYRILSKNGFAPEWVELNKEIRFHMERWRRALRFSWSRKMDAVSGDESRREALWRADLRILEEELKDINKKVFHYNLIVPFGRQVFCYRMEDELRQEEDMARRGYGRKGIWPDLESDMQPSMQSGFNARMASLAGLLGMHESGPTFGNRVMGIGNASEQFDATYYGGNFTEASNVRKATTFLKGNALQWWTTLLMQGRALSCWIQFKQFFSFAWLTNTFKVDVMIA